MVCLRGRHLRSPLLHGRGSLASSELMENPTRNRRFANVTSGLDRWTRLACLACMMAAGSGLALAQGNGTQAPWNKRSRSARSETKPKPPNRREAWKGLRRTTRSGKRGITASKKHVRSACARAAKGPQTPRWADRSMVARIWLRKRWESARMSVWRGLFDVKLNVGTTHSSGLQAVHTFSRGRGL